MFTMDGSGGNGIYDPLGVANIPAPAPARVGGILGTGLASRAAKPGYDDPGGLHDKLNTLAAHLMMFSNPQAATGLLGGVNDRQQLALQQQQADAQQQWRQAEASKAMLPQIFNGGNGQITAVDPSTMAVTQLQAPQPVAPHVSEQQQLIDEWARRRAANPNDPTLSLLERAVHGYQYTAPVMNARQQNSLQQIGARGAQARQTRGTPTYGNLHPHNGTGGSTGGAALHVSDADLLAALRGGR